MPLFFFFIWTINVGEPKPQTVKLHAMAWLVVRQVAQMWCDYTHLEKLYNWDDKINVYWNKSYVNVHGPLLNFIRKFFGTLSFQFSQPFGPICLQISLSTDNIPTYPDSIQSDFRVEVANWSSHVTSTYEYLII